MIPLLGFVWETCGKALVLPLEQWERLSKSKENSRYIYGVDVGDSQAFLEPDVLSAVEFANLQHKDQKRKTGEPYIVHCLQTALIVEQYLLCARVQGGAQLKNVVIAAILHDVVSDTKQVSMETLREKFGPYVQGLVQEVSNMGAINQLMRRTKRYGNAASMNEGKIVEMILNATRNPFSIIIKLADRLHNMRTAYVLKSDRQAAIAAETQRLWCRLAEKLGLFELKSELEDLCFAVLQPEEFRKILQGLNNMWGPRISGEEIPAQSILSSLLPFNQDILSPGNNFNMANTPLPPFKQPTPAFVEILSPQQQSTKQLLQNVLPFHQSYFQKTLYSRHSQEALKMLGSCAQKLYQEIRVESVAVGHDVEIYGRVKSLYSIFKKMNRKKIPLEEVYDARALRVIVDDSDSQFNTDSAIRACYRLLPVVQRLWKKIPREDDDYIANPKRTTGYQSLHTAVIGPDGLPMEVQIRTRSMHQSAEYGQAAHWVYKEGPSQFGTHSCDCTEDDDQSIKIGHPVLKVDNGNLSDGVVVSVGDGNKSLEVAVWLPCRLRKSGERGERAPLFKYANIYRYALSNGLLAEENSYDAFMKIERYILRGDRYCLSDHFGKRYRDRYLSILELCPQEQQLIYSLIQDVIQSEQQTICKLEHIKQKPFEKFKTGFKMDLEDYGLTTINPFSTTTTSSATSTEGTTEQNLLENTENDPSMRSILRLRQQLGSIEYHGDVLDLQNKEKYISVFTWPDGDVSEIAPGTTAEDLIRNMGKISIVNSDQDNLNIPKDLININNQLVSTKTVLQNGDYVVLGDQILDI